MSVRSRGLKGAAVVAAALIGLSVIGCSSGGEENTAAEINLDAPAPTPPSGVSEFMDIEEGSGDGLTIGFTQLTLASPFPAALQAGMEAAAEKAGVELITCDSQGDTATALDCARQFDTQGVDGLITFQGDASAAESICTEGPDVPVIAIDIVQDPCQDVFVGAANQYAGELVGYNVGKYFAEESNCEYDAYISLESTAVGIVNEQRMGGTRDGFESVCGPIHDERVLDTGPGGQTELAQTQFTDTLTALPGAKKIIVVGINEDVINGALAAARAQNRSDDIYIGVQNLDPAQCAILGHKNWIGSVAYFPERYPELALPALISLIKGEEQPAELLVPHQFITNETLSDYYPESDCG